MYYMYYCEKGNHDRSHTYFPIYVQSFVKISFINDFLTRSNFSNFQRIKWLLQRKMTDFLFVPLLTVA